MDQAVRIVRRMCRLRCVRGPWFPRACLRQALALYATLTRLGYPVAIHVGVSKAEVGKEDGNLAALPFQCAAGGQDRLG
jgi:Transglutaminase-like superfamily